MIRYIVIDDEPLARERTIIQISPRENWQLLAQAEDVDEALALCEEHAPDVCFIDLTLVNSNGFDLATQLADSKFNTKVVFITGSNSKAVDAFDLNVSDYLLKPVSYARMEKCLDKLELELKEQDNQPLNNSSSIRKQIAVKSLGKIELVNVDDIFWIHGASNYVELHMEKRVLLHRESLSKLQAEIDSEQFIRVHRSSIVNLDKVKVINSEEGRFSLINMNNGDEVRISNAYRKTLLDRLGVR